MELAEKILNRLDMAKPQRDFLLTLYPTILAVRGKVNFRNLSRYSDLSEKTYSRQFAQSFDSVCFNRQLIDAAIGRESERILAFDPSFIIKSGKKTYGRAFFWNGSHSRVEKGLEISAFAVVDMARHTGFTLSVRQTDPHPQGHSDASSSVAIPADTLSDKKARKPTEETLIDGYLQHLKAVRPSLLEVEKHVVVDGYFAKKKWIDGVEELDLHTIGKLRCDADMRYFYTGPKRENGSG